ncbi:NEDD4-binding protein 2-like 1 [Numida meleagris]|uniref:NEDD4-binding protein 2-like 1 n=1 Tax=Numida meleagris TaxID=8996 RepID=UPI000B3DAC38|nr:NEDD4-binding protein 2-like 1 [Numida meleagris]
MTHLHSLKGGYGEVGVGLFSLVTVKLLTLIPPGKDFSLQPRILNVRSNLEESNQYRLLAAGPPGHAAGSCSVCCQLTPPAPCHTRSFPAAPPKPVATRGVVVTGRGRAGPRQLPPPPWGPGRAVPFRAVPGCAVPCRMEEQLLRALGGLSLQPPPRRSPRRFGKTLVLLRGLPGSGKSTLARQLKCDYPSAVVLSTDDFFSRNGVYVFDPDFLEDAHKWNQKRARKAMKNGKSPVIIDNTNIHAWEMKPYVMMARENSYEVIFREPDTPWKFNVRELTRKNIHDVPRQKIQQMKEQYEHYVTFHSVLHSEKPSREDRSSPGPSAAYGLGACAPPPAAFSSRRPRMARTNNPAFY